MTRYFLLLLLTGLAPRAWAGPPAVCWEVEIGKAKSLPWNEKDYTAARAVKDTLALLRPRTPVLVRMETLRRAGLRIHDDAEARRALLVKLMARALDGEAKGQPDALAWFDAGYAIGVFHQLGMIDGRDGYAWVKRAIRLRGEDPAMEFAGALLTLMGSSRNHKHYFAHVESAVKGAPDGSLLRQNLLILSKRAPAVLRYFKKERKK